MQNPGVFRVFVNQVDVGALPEQDYRAILSEAKREVKGDIRLYLAQALNLIGCLFRATKLFVQFMPVTMFLGGALALFAAPDEVEMLIAAIRAATPAEVTNCLRMMLLWTALGVTIILLAAVIAGYGFGYIDQFQSAIGERVNLRIRRLLEVPADGEMTVHVSPGFHL